MRCPFCYNYKLVLPEHLDKEKSFEEKQILSFLKKRKKYLDGLVITGGEPTIQNDLPSFLGEVKEMGYSVKLDTNGLLPEVLKKLISQKLIDYIAMDIKGPLGEYSKYCGIEDTSNIKESIALVMNSDLSYEFRTTFAKGLHSIEDAVKIGKDIKGAELYFLQGFRDEPTLNPKARLVGFTPAEMEKMRMQCEKFVKKCSIR